MCILLRSREIALEINRAGLWYCCPSPKISIFIQSTCVPRTLWYHSYFRLFSLLSHKVGFLLRVKNFLSFAYHKAFLSLSLAPIFRRDLVQWKIIRLSDDPFLTSGLHSVGQRRAVVSLILFSRTYLSSPCSRSLYSSTSYWGTPPFPCDFCSKITEYSPYKTKISKLAPK